jgi:mannose-6-phosphate isomerase-like protein (cupin superfamily)
MKRFLILSLISLPFFTQAQDYQSLDTIKFRGPLMANYMRPLYSDSLASSFVIFIPIEVKEHKHVDHSEQVVVLEGFAEMTLGDKKFYIKKGDFIFIPQNTWHSVVVKTSVPLKVLSIQSPRFDGKDRVFKEDTGKK